MFQHKNGSVNENRPRNVVSIKAGSEEKKLKSLPKEYIDIQPTILNKNIEIRQPNILHGLPLGQAALPSIEDETYFSETKWLDYVRDCIEKSQQGVLDLSWAGFHASKIEKTNDIPDATALLLLFKESSKSPAMIKHALDVIANAVTYLNESQPVVAALDQPLYAIAKKIQWQWPEQYGVHKFVFMLGGLHTEMAYLSALGDWLDESGWVNCLSESDIATTGVAESLLGGGKVSKSRYFYSIY